MRLVHILVDGLLVDGLLLLPALTLVGLLLAKKHLPEAATGTGRVLVGVLTLLIGFTAVAQALGSMDSLLAALLTRDVAGGRPAAMEPMFSPKGDYAHAQAVTVLLAYGINVVWVRFGRVRHVFLNPIHLLFLSAVLLIHFLRADVSVYVAVPVVAVVVGSAMAWLPYLAERPTNLMGRSDVALGSMNTGLLLGVGWLAQKIGGSAKGTKKKAKGEGAFVGVPIVLAGAIVGALCLLLAINAGDKATEAILGKVWVFGVVPGIGGGYYLIGALMLGFIFAGGLWVVIRSAPVVLEGLVDAFSGYARLLPGVQPAVDAVFMLPESPRAATYGFLGSLVGGTIGYYLFGNIGMTGAVPGILVAMTAGHLLGGGAAGIVSERIGGSKALLILAPVHGLALSLLVSVSFAGPPGPAARLPAVELSDVSILGTLIGLITRLLG